MWKNTCKAIWRFSILPFKIPGSIVRSICNAIQYCDKCLSLGDLIFLYQVVIVYKFSISFRSQDRTFIEWSRTEV